MFLDLDYLRRIAQRTDLSVLFHDATFLAAQDLFFSVVNDMHGEVDFEIADMREVHAVAALWDSAQENRMCWKTRFETSTLRFLQR
jgi:hypothetical protein